MTDAEIIKALECHNICRISKCEECPLFPTNECSAELSGYAIDLVNRKNAKINQLEQNLKEAHIDIKEKQAEIERRKNNLFCKVVIDEETMRSIINEKVQEFELDIKSIKAEAIKEFAERLKDNINDIPRMEYGSGDLYYLIGKDFVDNLVKEMVGDTE